MTTISMAQTFNGKLDTDHNGEISLQEFQTSLEPYIDRSAPQPGSLTHEGLRLWLKKNTGCTEEQANNAIANLKYDRKYIDQNRLYFAAGLADYYPAIYNDGVPRAGLDPARMSYDDAMGPIGTKANSSSRFSDEERFINDLFKNGPDQITQRMRTIDACYASKTDQIVKLNDRSVGENIFVPTESGGLSRAIIYRQYDMADGCNGGNEPHTSLKSIHNNWRRRYPADTAPTGEQDVIMRNQ